MIRDYWYIIAFTVVITILTIQLEQFVICVLFFIWLVWLQNQNKIPLFVLIISFMSFIFFYMYIPSSQTIESIPNPFVEKQMTFHGKIKGPITQTEAKVEFIFRDEKMSEDMLVVYFLEDETKHQTEMAHLLSGGTCTFKGNMQIPDRARNPHQFDYQQYLLQQGITYQIILSSLSEVACHDASLFHYIYSIRTVILENTVKKFDTETVAWLHALVLGDDSNIDSNVIDVFQRWSLSHILAISGLHIGIIVGMIYVLLVRFLFFTKEIAQWMLVGFLPIYALIAGGQPSVWRASLMVLCVILLSKLKWKLNYTDVISIVFLLLILFDPFIIYHIGFQLSFIVTFGLIISQVWIMQSRSNMIRILQISFISQMMILPLQLHYFNLFQPLSIVLNLLIVPYFSFFVIPKMFGLLLVQWLPTIFLSILEDCFLFIHEHVLWMILWVDEYLDYPFVIGDISIYFTVIYYVLLVMLMKALENEQLKRAFRYAICVTALLVVMTLRPYFSSVGTVTMLDIGQGDAFVIELPYRKGVFFIDMGTPLAFPDFQPTERVYKQVIQPYLYGQGITKIDAVFLSHEDLDHYGSLMYALDEIVIDEIIISPYYEIDEENARLWKEKEMAVYRMKFNELLVRRGQSFQALSPSENQFDANENSLVLLTQLGGKDWIFTGDIGKETEKKIVKSFPNLAADVLKVGHHGSNTSTDPTFIEKTKPKEALISVGRNNSYGHPTKEVIETLQNESITIYRTDEHGAVQYFFKEEHGVFRPFLSH